MFMDIEKNILKISVNFNNFLENFRRSEDTLRYFRIFSNFLEPFQILFDYYLFV